MSKAQDKKQEYVGREFITKQGDVAKIISIIGNKMVVTFEGYEDYPMEFNYRTPSNGMTLKNYLAKSVYGVGYLGTKYAEEAVNPKYHSRWRGMIGRCYSDSWQKRSDKATVCEEWHCFANFDDWMKSLPFAEEEWHIDKDLEEMNLYSPATVHYIPECINHAISVLQSAIVRCETKPIAYTEAGLLSAYVTLRGYAKEYESKLADRTNTKLTELLEKAKNMCIDILR